MHARSAPAACNFVLACVRNASSATTMISDSNLVIAAASATYVDSTASSRSAQSVPACGQAINTAACGSHSAGRRKVESVMGTTLAQRKAPETMSGEQVHKFTMRAGAGRALLVIPAYARMTVSAISIHRAGVLIVA